MLEALKNGTEVMEMWFVHCEYPAGIVGITAREELPLQIMCLIYWLNSFSVLPI